MLRRLGALDTAAFSLLSCLPPSSPHPSCQDWIRVVHTMLTRTEQARPSCASLVDPKLMQGPRFQPSSDQSLPSTTGPSPHFPRPRSQTLTPRLMPLTPLPSTCTHLLSPPFPSHTPHLTVWHLPVINYKAEAGLGRQVLCLKPEADLALIEKLVGQFRLQGDGCGGQ